MFLILGLWPSMDKAAASYLSSLLKKAADRGFKSLRARQQLIIQK